jgi:cytochrome c553
MGEVQSAGEKDIGIVQHLCRVNDCASPFPRFPRAHCPSLMSCVAVRMIACSQEDVVGHRNVRHRRVVVGVAVGRGVVIAELRERDVAHGHKPNVTACSFCHYPDGKGRPVNTNIAGLPYAYILQTLADFKNEARRSADTRKTNTNQMIGFAKSMSDDEMKAAAQYFSSLKWTPWITVVETDMVPKTRIANGIFLRLEGDAKEPIGQRIIETPENVEAMEVLRDDRSGFIAYVPVGSISKGAALVTAGGGGKTIRCTSCHGADLMGLGPVPGLAGRSPSYLVRQLYDMQHGTRSGMSTSLMLPVVTRLTTDDMLAIAAYLASLDVSSASATTATN